jgi:hypothetical protein
MVPTLTAPQQVKRRFITHPDATFAHIATARYSVEARLFQGCEATSHLEEFGRW